MPKFLCYCPDYPDALERRLAVRPVHLERAKKDWDTGAQVEGGPFKPTPGSEQANRVVPEGKPNIAGSYMVYVMEDIDQVWERLKSDAYWENNVWDRERLAVCPLL